MTKAFYPVTFLLLLNLTAPVITAQTPTLINREWVDTTTGSTPVYSKNYEAATTDGSSYYLLQDAYMTGQLANYQITKIDSTGSTIYQTQFNSIRNLNDYGTGLYLNGNYLYVTGFSYDSVNGTAVFNTLKLNAATGDTIVTRTYQGGYAGLDIPAEIIADDSGNIYVCGSEATGAATSSMVLLKYDANLNFIWKAYYDSAGLYNAAVAMVLTPETNIAVTGVSGTGFTSLDFETATFNLAGAPISTARSVNSTGFSEPVNIIRDQNNDFIVVGTAASSIVPGNTCIQLIFYDSTLTQQWVQTYGDSTSATASDVYNDGSGHLVVCGTVNNTSGGKDMVALSYHHFSGSLNWAQQIGAPDPTKEASAAALTYDNNGNSYMVGRMYNSATGHFDMSTVGLDVNGNTNFMASYSTPGTDNNATIPATLRVRIITFT